MKMLNENFSKTKYEFGKLINQVGRISKRIKGGVQYFEDTHTLFALSLSYVYQLVGKGVKNMVQPEILPTVVSIFQIVVALQILLTRGIILQEG